MWAAGGIPVASSRINGDAVVVVAVVGLGVGISGAIAAGGKRKREMVVGGRKSEERARFVSPNVARPEVAGPFGGGP